MSRSTAWSRAGLRRPDDEGRPRTRSRRSATTSTPAEEVAASRIGEWLRRDERADARRPRAPGRAGEPVHPQRPRPQRRTRARARVVRLWPHRRSPRRGRRHLRRGRDRGERVREQLDASGDIPEPGVALRVDPPAPEQAPPVEVDCAARMHVCQAVCCKLDFALTADEVEHGVLRWDLGRPYLIRHEGDGWCTQRARERPLRVCDDPVLRAYSAPATTEDRLEDGTQHGVVGERRGARARSREREEGTSSGHGPPVAAGPSPKRSTAWSS